MFVALTWAGSTAGERDAIAAAVLDIIRGAGAFGLGAFAFAWTAALSLTDAGRAIVVRLASVAGWPLAIAGARVLIAITRTTATARKRLPIAAAVVDDVVSAGALSGRADALSRVAALSFAHSGLAVVVVAAR